ncbi:MAG TPA: hypothetical protein VHP62_01715 [Usitatibacter sp.]|jgi:hypothetical protein|nr:hypothetical protein [Usitatibacter sp.]
MLEPSKNGLAWIDDLTGGLNTTDPPEKIADNQLQIAQNIEWTQTNIAQRRQGGQNNIGTEPWASGASLLAVFRHIPGNSETGAEMFAVSTGSPNALGRLTASANFASVTVGDAIDAANDGKFADAVSFNSKWFFAYDSAVDRLHVWNGTSLRRVGLPKPTAAPTVANTGGGTYAAVQRWYKVQWFNDTERVLGPLSDAVAFTPSGAGTAARVTRPTAAGEHETKWVLYGSPDNVNFYLIASVAIGTTTFDDSTAPSAYATVASSGLSALSSDLDYYTTPPSPKYLLVDGARLLLLSSWETAAYTSRVWFTPILHTTSADIADDERVPSTNYLDLDPSEGGGLTGGAMLNGTPYIFKTARTYRLNATTNATKPYTRAVISRIVGALSHRSIVLGEDDQGNQCLYFLSRRGPYRLSDYGLEYLGHDLEFGTWSTVNKTGINVPPFGIYYEQKHQVWWWVTTGSNSNPDTVLVLSIPHARRAGDGSIRGGWTTFTGDLGAGIAAVMFSKTLAATMSLDLKPYVAQVNNAAGDPDGPLVQYDADAVYTDGGARATAYTGKFKTKAFNPGGRDKRGGVLEGFITAKATGCTFNLSAIRNYGQETIPASVTISGDTALSRDDVKIENLTLGEAKALELQIDDGGAARAWTIDTIGLRIEAEGER